MITNTWIIWGAIFGITGFSVWSSNNTKWGRFLGFVNVSIILGLIVGNLGILPASHASYTTVMTAFVPVGIVMMLFMADLSKLKKVGLKMIVCMIVSAVVLVIAAIIASLIFNIGDENWKFAGLAASYFTGNFQTSAGNASSFAVSNEVFLYFQCAVVFPWIMYSLICPLIGRTPIPKFLGSYKNIDTGVTLSKEEQDAALAELNQKEKKLNINEVAVVLGTAVLIVGVSMWLSEITGIYSILFYATFGVLVANFTPIKHYVINDYIATFIFSMYMLTTGLAGRFSVFASLPWQAFANIVFIYLFSFAVYPLVLKLLHMPWEFGLLAHMACVGGPITTPPLAKQYGWNDLVLPGIVIAVLGQVFGAYCGVLAGTIVRMLGA